MNDLSIGDPLIIFVKDNPHNGPARWCIIWNTHNEYGRVDKSIDWHSAANLKTSYCQSAANVLKLFPPRYDIIFYFLQILIMMDELKVYLRTKYINEHQSLADLTQSANQEKKFNTSRVTPWEKHWKQNLVRTVIQSMFPLAFTNGGNIEGPSLCNALAADDRLSLALHFFRRLLFVVVNLHCNPSFLTFVLQLTANER
jgi:hypothetical protein